MTKQRHDRVEAPAGGGQDRPSGSPVHPDIDTLQPDATSAGQLGAELNRRQPQSQEPEPPGIQTARARANPATPGWQESDQRACAVAALGTDSAATVVM